MSVMVRSLWRSKRSVQVQLRSTRSHVRGHYRHNYHVASTPDAFQLRGIDEARRGEASFSSREKPYAAPCMLPIAVDAFTSKGWRGSGRSSAYRFICILVCRCKSFNYVHHKSRHGPSVCSCARARVCSHGPSSSVTPSLPPGSTPVHTLGGPFCDEKRDTLGGR